jgi:hypothetical protein
MQHENRVSIRIAFVDIMHTQRRAFGVSPRSDLDEIGSEGIPGEGVEILFGGTKDLQ